MIRFIIKRVVAGEGEPPFTSYETFDVAVPELEQALRRGGHGAGYDYSELVGAEVLDA